MIFIINGKKYDTEKMHKIANVRKWYSLNNLVMNYLLGGKDVGRFYDCELWRSDKGNWLLTSERDYEQKIGDAIGEEEAKSLLIKYNLSVYESIYGTIEEV